MAYKLWAVIEDERLTRGWSAVRMAEALGMPRNTIDRLRSSPRKPYPETVHKIADALRRLGVDIDRRRAEQLAGLRPQLAEPGAVSVREAIMRDPLYTEQQRAAMLQLVAIFEQANQQRGDDEPGQATG